MDAMLQFGLFGDSLMKGTLPCEGLRYSFHREILESLLASVRAVVVNKAKFGATIRKGFHVMQKDLARGSRYDYALLGYGGNDCNYDWPGIAENPAGQHAPAVALPDFTDTLEQMIDTLLAQGTRPVLMTLPPIDSEKYLDYLNAQGLDRAAILQWLGDPHRIYRTQELYSNAVFKTAVRRELPCVDARAAFLRHRNFPALISNDGIHPSAEGYALLYGTVIEELRNTIK